MCENLSIVMCFKTVRLTTIRNGLKQTRSTSGGFGLLQMTLELGTEECARLPREWIVRSCIGWRGERNISYKGVEASL